MSTGARSTEQWREHRALLEAIQRGGPVTPPEPAPAPVEVELDDAPPPVIERAGAIALAVVAVLWVAAIMTSLQAGAGPITEIAGRISLASGPLALLGIVYLLLQRTSRREATRFGRTAAAMRAEANALDTTVAKLTARIDDNRKAVAEHAQELLSLGEDSALRLAELAARMQSETRALGLQSEKLEAASSAAFTDMGVLMADMPRVEGQVHTLSAMLRDTGRDANERATSLSAELGRLSERAREVDEVAGGAAQRLSAHLARIESISDAAGNRIDAAADGIARTVDSALTSAADAVDATRASIEVQSSALLAMVDQSKAAFERAGDDTAETLAGRVAAVTSEVERIGTRLGGHDDAARRLLDMLAERIAGLDRALAEVDLNGTARATQLAAHLRGLVEGAQAAAGAMTQGHEAADGLIVRGERLQVVIAGCTSALEEHLPSLLGSLEESAARGGDTIDSLLPKADALAATLAAADRAIASLDSQIATRGAALDGIGQTAVDQLATLEGRARDIDAVLAETGERATALAGSAGPQLVEALVRVRETANQAAEQVKRSFSEAIQQAAEQLGTRSRAALDEQLAVEVEHKLAQIAAASTRAVEAAHEAGRQIDARLAAIANATGLVEQRISDGGGSAPAVSDRAVSDRAVSGEGVSTRVAELIEQLNAISVDVAKLLSSDIPDTLWAAYLNGDRGIFTRHAMRLVDAGEAGEIAHRYEDDAAFRDQVDRYIRDFEAMLRHILANRDGSLLGVTLLSADMGKLYVVLAQAIERLRA